MTVGSAQRIYIPAECPECHGPVCVTDLSPPTGMAHCHDRRTETTCGWSQQLALDEDAPSYCFISVEPTP